MKRNVSVVHFKFRFNILISGKIIKEMPASVVSGTPCIIDDAHYFPKFKAYSVPDKFLHKYRLRHFL